MVRDMTALDTFAARYLSGDALWGDDFTPQQIEEWFADEREAYADLGSASSSAEAYGYHGLNLQSGYRHLPGRRFAHALGVGSAFGGEFLPLLGRIDKITILEPSSRLRSTDLRGVPLRYVDPSPAGDMPFETDTFELAVCLGVLHHIPNVTKVVQEMGRVVAPGGWVVVREPVVSMGDWRSRQHPGLTKRERGIPRRLLEAAVRDAGFSIRSSVFCAATLTPRIGRVLGRNLYGTRWGAAVDRALAVGTAWNYQYHADNLWQKLRPSAVCIVAQRQ
jgi:SAM-dependent methyltransferase